MWECDLERQKKTKPRCAAILFRTATRHQHVLTLKMPCLEDEQNVIKLYHKTEDDEKIRYYDFTFLHPIVPSHEPYPVGIVKCTVPTQRTVSP